MTPMHVLATPDDAARRLDGFGLRLDDLGAAVRHGLHAAATCTPHDPPNFAGLLGWGRTVRGLRDTLVPRGWHVDNSRNYPTAVSPDGTIAIAVAAGDYNTGLAGTPATRSAKGPATREAVVLNQMSFAELDASFALGVPVPKSTWLLLHYNDKSAKEVRMELSLPAGFDEEGVVTDWHERIILPPLTTAYEPPDDPGDSPIDVPIVRR